MQKWVHAMLFPNVRPLTEPNSVMCWDVLTRNTNIYDKWMAVIAFLQTKDVKPHLLQGFTGAEYEGNSRPADYMWGFLTKADCGEPDNVCTMTVQYGLEACAGQHVPGHLQEGDRCDSADAE
jgi:hypothetical protein